jgi:hypothetical protein
MVVTVLLPFDPVMAITGASAARAKSSISPMHSTPAWAAAAMAGMLAGWFHVHRSLGKGFVRAALAGINAGITALLYFAVLAAAYNTLRAYRYTKFDTATALLEHVVLRIVDVCLVALEPQVCATILIGSAVAGTYAEQMRRAWD